MNPPASSEKNGRYRLNVGDVAHLGEIAVLAIALLGFYTKVDEALKMVGEDRQKLIRIEHYLSSKDANYWKISKDEE